jgi:DNA-directed RNA polymerase subunit N
MIIPVRCFTCGKVVGNKWVIFQKKQEEGISNEQIFKDLHIKRYCCRRMLLTHVDLIDKILMY